MTPEQDALFRQAVTLHRSGQAAQARDLYLRILGDDPDVPEVLGMLGAAEIQLGDPTEGLRCFDAALALQPAQANILQNRGTVLSALGRFDEAVQSYEQSLRLQPNNPDTWFSHGNALQTVDRGEEALNSYERALRLRPDYVGALNNRGNVLQGLLRIGEAVRDYERALAIRPDFPWLPGHALHMRMQIAKWDDFDARRDALVARILRGEAVAAPMHVLALTDRPDVHLAEARTFAVQRYPAQGLLPPLAGPRRATTRQDGRLRVGYFSTDFKNHPVSHLMAGVLEQHDRSRFEVFAFALESKVRDAMRTRIEGAVEHVIDVAEMSDLDVTQKARDLGLDIAIDLNGFTLGHRTAIFAERAAPVQVSYLGYLGSMGADYYDYLIADAVIVPDDRRGHYAEKVAHLPCFQVNDDRTAPAAPPSRAELGLPEDAFVFCAFNQTYKITPEVFDGWMRILNRAPGSVLWIYAETADAVLDLTLEAGRRGIGEERLVFAARVPLAEHVARQGAADLFLDTHPYNAGATASHVLRAGVPVLTRIGETFPARMGASLLTAVGLEEMIADTPQAYEDLAVALATDPERMAAVRAKLAANLPGSILFDTQRATRALETLFEEMAGQSTAKATESPPSGKRYF